MHLIKSILFFLLCSLSVFANTPPLATKITDLAGKSVTYNYNTDDDLSSVTDQMGSSENSFLFTGEQFDKESDNYYLRARYYSPEQARFTSIDPFEGRVLEPITLNDYIYAGNNPIIYTDPSGEFFISSVLSISTTILSTLPRTSLTIQQGTALSINAYFIRLGIALRGEAMESIIFGIYGGVSKDGMQAAYDKYYYSTQLISNMSNLAGPISSSIGWGNAAIKFANSFHSPLIAYKTLSEKIGKGLESIVKLESRKTIKSERIKFEELIRASSNILDRTARELVR